MKSYTDITKILAQKDPILKKAIESVRIEIKPTPSIDIYWYLLNSITSQQLSVKVVRIIWKRFLELFPNEYPSAESILSFEDQKLKSVGLSNAKVKYIKSVAQFSLDHDISFEYLDKLSDDEIIKYLTQISGVGKWTVQMILMFPMDRPNVFPVDDLGIQTNMKKWYNLDLEKKALKTKLIDIAGQWEPYQTLASKFIWESNPTD